jgi:hypothetical protein
MNSSENPESMKSPYSKNPMAAWDGAKVEAQINEVMKNANLSFEQFDK